MPDDIQAFLHDVNSANVRDTAAMARLGREHLADAVAHARAQSPYFRDLYRGLPDGVDDPRLLPVTKKAELMARFDDWVTDPDVKLSEVRAFAADPDLVGDRLLGRYLVSMTSGTAGVRGFFLHDDRMITMVRTLGYRSVSGVLGADRVPRGGRTATVVAMGGPIGMNVGLTAEQKSGTPMGMANRMFSVHLPLDELVAQLNDYQPDVLWCYATVTSLLAGEALAGRLRIKPATVSLFGEGLSEPEYPMIAKAFPHSAVLNIYASNENGATNAACSHGWFHPHQDWILLEPVDADYQPTPPGEHSHTVLLSVLYNRIQPILRYDLGDSLLVQPDPCPCGDPLPGFRVYGHATTGLTFTKEDGSTVTISSLVAETVGERVEDIRIFQVAHTAPATVRVRMMLMDGAGQESIWQRVCAGLRGLLDDRGLANVTVERATEPPEISEGGKYPILVPYRAP